MGDGLAVLGVVDCFRSDLMLLCFAGRGGEYCGSGSL